jgi:hypothetical protein
MCISNQHRQRWRQNAWKSWLDRLGGILLHPGAWTETVNQNPLPSCAASDSSRLSGDGFCPQLSQNPARHSWDVGRKMELDDLSEKKLGQLMTMAAERGTRRGQDIQDALAELLARRQVGEKLLAYLDEETTKCSNSMLRSAISFWANHIRRVKDL